MFKIYRYYNCSLNWGPFSIDCNQDIAEVISDKQPFNLQLQSKQCIHIVCL